MATPTFRRRGVVSPLREDGLERTCVRLRALADPTRLRILRQLLASEDAVCVCDISAGFDLGQPTISHHLRVLREAGLVRRSRRGTWMYYRPDRSALATLTSALGEL